MQLAWVVGTPTINFLVLVVNKPVGQLWIVFLFVRCLAGSSDSRLDRGHFL